MKTTGFLKKSLAFLFINIRDNIKIKHVSIHKNKTKQINRKKGAIMRHRNQRPISHTLRNPRQTLN